MTVIELHKTRWSQNSYVQRNSSLSGWTTWRKLNVAGLLIKPVNVRLVYWIAVQMEKSESWVRVLFGASTFICAQKKTRETYGSISSSYRLNSRLWKFSYSKRKLLMQYSLWKKAIILKIQDMLRFQITFKRLINHE